MQHTVQKLINCSILYKIKGSAYPVVETGVQVEDLKQVTTYNKVGKIT